jgi:hypothetical protein
VAPAAIGRYCGQRVAGHVLRQLVRLSGKRSLAKLIAFDWIVSVALGSTLATILLSSDVSWSEGVVALALLPRCSSRWRGRRRTSPAAGTW